MSVFGPDVCVRCYTTHPLNEAGERICPKPPIQERELSAPAVIWKTHGATKGYRGGGSIPKTDQLVPNPGHSAPTVKQLGLTYEQVQSLGI